MATNEIKNPEGKNIPVRPRPSGSAVENFWMKNQRLILAGVAIIVLGVAGYFVYQGYVQAPKEQKAAEAIWKAEEYFRMDSAQLALNGDGPNQGFLKIISRYEGTKAGNLAKFYAGASYMKLGDYNNAIKFLKDFSSEDKLIAVRAKGLLGDAYAETGKKKEALNNYRHAGVLFPEDTHNSPEYLFRAGLIFQELGQNQEAIEMFKKIKAKYPSTERGVEIDKYLARLGSVD